MRIAPGEAEARGKAWDSGLGRRGIRVTGWPVGAGTIQDPSYVREAFARIADRYVTTNHVLSLGTDILWRRKVARMVRRWKPGRVLDVATGTGDLALEIQDACPGAEVIGSDFCAEMLAHAGRRGLAKTLVADALALPFGDGEFDVVTVAFGLRNMADYAAAIREMRRVLKPGGHLLVLDFSLPEGPLKIPYRWYLHHVLPRMAGFLTGQTDAYEYLGGSIEEFPRGRSMCQLLEREGFSDAEALALSFGVAAVYIGRAS
ncbi:MAG: ubiquinone/menaquinone biosynthesis methyltransferase [Verrucomicrobia bacterium]|nr:MAG: ubiquinone/menaquinone biosynthesis methyltransferase [Verrucomicrobiota bacterium]TAE86106.1 MAG: ubiquinone/menaquinone biosynthesis methyltransferase [Verrucomicrobiota bacterium]TAF23453.1 MAG: ubiquinone/menaquinone biosynthesis methyltransferase [Verrucomicrobiota bacterium]TAF40083.1 MAG: ubiquinone/menaquinone biosynthesis methyltransferase [Verrucomicrobiota bacterium]